MDRDGVNGVYNRPYESLYSRCFRWLGLWAEWQHVLENGANALKSTDGQILNGIRNRMAYCRNLRLVNTRWMMCARKHE